MELEDFDGGEDGLELYELRERVGSPMGPFRVEFNCDLDGQGPPGPETLREAELLVERFRRDAAELTRRVHAEYAQLAAEEPR